jgi:iron complex transport system ATP-binding protein
MSLAVRGVTFSFGRSEILKGVGFEAPERQILTILGPNGSGKTTLLKCINRILEPAGGTIIYDGEDMRRLPLKRLAEYMSYVPQDHGTVFPISVIDTILMGRIPHSGIKIRGADKDAAFGALEIMDLGGLAFRKMNQLSGGERQRVAIARALAQEAPILIMDEPTSNLDVRNQLETLGLIRSIVEENGLIAVLSLHDINLAAMFSHRVVMVKDRGIFEEGAVEQVVNEGNLKAVYGVDTAVHSHDGETHVRLLKPGSADPATET